MTRNRLNCGPRPVRRQAGAFGNQDYEAMEDRKLMSGTPGMPGPELAAVFTAHAGLQDGGPIQRIVNGTVTSQFPSVGKIGDNSGFFCSGTLIAPRYVLTAAHCAEGVGQTAGRFQANGQTYNTSRVFVHPNYNGNLIGSDNANDIAIYQLDRDATGVASSPIFRATPAVGQLLTLVGFGAGGTGNSGHDGSCGTKRVGTTPIDQVTSRLIHWNFDNNNEANTAPGDSGGPAFLSVNGTYHVAGITSGGDQANAGIGDHSFDTRVDVFASWIDSVVGTTGGGITPVVSIAAFDSSAAETLAGQTANTGSYRITRTGSLTSPLTVNLARGGTATSGSDFFALPTSVTIPAGAASTIITLTPRDDSLVEGTETVALFIATGTGYQAGAGGATVSIFDNEQATWNNQFANRQTIAGALATVTGTNAGATKEAGEPNVLGLSGGKSVWWTWTAPVTGTTYVSTSGSNYDTTLGIYQGTTVSSLSFVAANDDENLFAGIYTSRLSFQAVAGQTYQFLVDGYQGDSGSIKLTLDQPAGRKAKVASGGKPTAWWTPGGHHRTTWLQQHGIGRQSLYANASIAGRANGLAGSNVDDHSHGQRSRPAVGRAPVATATPGHRDLDEFFSAFRRGLGRAAALRS
jgi:Trypsin